MTMAKGKSVHAVQDAVPVPTEHGASIAEIAPERLIVVEHYVDDDPYAPSAYARFIDRVTNMRGDDITAWRTIVVDSITSMDIAARLWFRYTVNPVKGGPVDGRHPSMGLHDTRPWRAATTDTLEENLYTRIGGWRTNVCVIAHIDEQKDEVSGSFVRNPAAPGRLSKRLPASYNELYKAYVGKGEKPGERVYALQTRNDGRMNANTSVEAPDPCWPEYEALWENWQGALRPLLHALVYGDSGVGKSTFASTWPSPMLVLMFDAIGKDMPYMKRGTVREDYVDVGGTRVQVIERAVA